MMGAALRCTSVLVFAAGVLLELGRVVPAAGLALVLGFCVAAYTWFLASAVTAPEASRRRRR
jgi:hypothetical protein